MTKRTKASKIKLESDAWPRFERFIRDIAKAGGNGERIRNVGSVAHQSADFDILTRSDTPSEGKSPCVETMPFHWEILVRLRPPKNVPSVVIYSSKFTNAWKRANGKGRGDGLAERLQRHEGELLAD
jgi:hypothetical protein